MITQDEFARRRQRVLSEIGRAVAIVPAAPIAIRNNDVEHDYRQESDLYYLTGFDEPESVLVLTNCHAEHKSVMFVRPRDPERETWDGPRAGVDGAKARYGADAAFPIAELEAKLPEYIEDVERLHFRFGANRHFDDVVFGAIQKARGKVRQGKLAPRELVDLGRLLHGMRLTKSSGEVDTMLRAVAISREAHARAMRVAKPGAYEYEVEAEMLRVFRQRGAERPAYGSIVASGPNATVLHYRRNDRRMADGDLLLIDAGAEYGYYASDVTRTFPVSGTFTAAQRAVYDVVLAAQYAAIATVAPGVPYMAVHDKAVEVLTQGMIDLALVEGPLEVAIKEERYKPYYMHRTSHWLGMDVHDVGDYFVDKKPRALEAGMVLTVEPGLYVKVDAACDPKWRGIGVRIEDDVLVTDAGHQVLTDGIPKDAAELERILQARG
jgi:Xaa-Pro aminopeptidase